MMLHAVMRPLAIRSSRLKPPFFNDMGSSMDGQQDGDQRTRLSCDFSLTFRRTESVSAQGVLVAVDVDPDGAGPATGEAEGGALGLAGSAAGAPAGPAVLVN